MKSLLAVTLCLLASCAQKPLRVDSVLATSPLVAQSAAGLVARLGIQKPVYVLDWDLGANLLGHSENFPDRYVVLINQDLDEVTKWTVLEHELAHVVVWDRGWEDTQGGHGESWGKAMALVHRTAVGEGEYRLPSRRPGMR